MSPNSLLWLKEKNEHAPLLRLLAQRRQTLLKNATIMPSMDRYESAAKVIYHHTGARFLAHELEQIFTLYPEVRIELGMNENAHAAAGVIMDAISHFFLGCPWHEPLNVRPRPAVYLRGSDHHLLAGERSSSNDAFISLLLTQAYEMGYGQGS